MSFDFRRIALVTAMVGAAMGGMAGGAEVLRAPAYSAAAPAAHPWKPRAGRIRTAGKHRPAGSKLWRKATEGKIGVRW